MAASLATKERLALCDLLEELGPDAPTLCEGWATKDLAAHLVVRERDPLAAPGILVGGPAAALTERAMARTRERGYHWMIDRLRGGPPLGPMRLPVVGEFINLPEFFIHHEDVRRANGRGPREDLDELDDALWGNLRRAARFMVRRVSGIGVELRRPDGASISARTGAPLVRIAGRPSEIILYMSGRKDAADVELDGPPEAVAKLGTSRLGI